MINSSEFDQVSSLLQAKITGSSPRWLFSGNLTNPYIKSSYTSRSYVIVMDTEKERSIGLGRRLNAPILEKDEIYITMSTMKGLGLSEG